MPVIKLLISNDLPKLKVVKLSFNLKEDKAEIQIYHTEMKQLAFDIKAWMWLSGGLWQFGWAIEKLNDMRPTTQMEEKIKLEIQKLLLPFFSGVQ